MLIAFAGIDGAGKSSQVKTLAERLGETGRSVKVIDKWDVLDPAIHPECRFMVGPLEEVRVCISEMEGPGRALFLFWCIALATTRSMKESHDYFISDGYWMKHAAAELALGCPRGMIEGYIEALPKADLTFYVDLDPALAFDRKGPADVTPYECGCDPEMKPEGFMRHQTNIRSILKEWAARDGWTSINGTADRESISAEILMHVLEHSGHGR